jgi:hypothetical protein
MCMYSNVIQVVPRIAPTVSKIPFLIQRVQWLRINLLALLCPLKCRSQHKASFTPAELLEYNHPFALLLGTGFLSDVTGDGPLVGNAG